MEEYGNNGIFGVDRKQMRAVDGKQEIYLEWPSADKVEFLRRRVRSFALHEMLATTCH